MKNALWTGVAGLVLIGGAASAQDLAFEPGEGPFDWAGFEEYKANAPDLSGQTVTIFGPWLSPEAEYFSNILAYFEDATGADATYTGSDGFEQQIVIDAEAGSPPNIAVFPQPGLAATMAAQGLLNPLPDDMGQWLGDNYAAGESWVDLGTYADENGEDQLFGYFYNVNVKSLVWYSPENFEDAGYEVPETMEDLIALSEQMIEDGETPWCIGLASGPATGWPATDWVEDIMLRTQAPEVYDQWVTNEIPFNDDRVKEAIETFGMFARNDDMVAGGAGGVASTDFRDSPTGLFASPPQCYMHRQASFATAFFPEDVVVGQDADFFYFPAFSEKDLGSPVLGAGTLMTITDANEATTEFMNFLKQPIAHELFMAQSGFLTPHTGVNIEAYRDDTLRKQGQILLDATTFRFDASDLMPGAVGAGTFWTGMVDYVGGADVGEVTDAIQSSWDALK